MTTTHDRDDAGAPERALFARAGALLFGPCWQRAIARALGVSERSVRYWLAGAHPIPPGVLRDLAALVDARQGEIAELIQTLDDREST